MATGQKRAKTIGELKESGYKPASVREELRRNMIKMIREKKNIFRHHRLR